jgi:hypothetical protein
MDPSKKDALAAFNHADELFRSGQHADALEILADLNGRFQHNRNILFSMALCLEKLGRKDQAARICNLLVTQFKDPRALQMTSRLHAQVEPAHPSGEQPTDHVALSDAEFGVLFGEYRRVLGVAASTVSGAVLVLANLVPLVGAVYFHWSVFVILLTFWMENVVIGFFNVLKIATAMGVNPSCGNPEMDAEPDWAGYRPPDTDFNLLGKFLVIPFFTLHYTVFCFAHLVLICGVFGIKSLPGGELNTNVQALSLHASSFHSFLIAIIGGQPMLHFIYLAAAGLFVSHGVSFFANYLWNGEYRRATVSDLAGQPYNRVVIMHLTVLVGSFFALQTGLQQYAVVVLVLLKIGTDLSAHFSERRKYRT